MPKITAIVPKPEKGRVWIFLDGEYATSVRERTFPALGLSIGKEITRKELDEVEVFHWKKAYGEGAWRREKVRLNKVKGMIESLDSRIEARISGFGADSAKLIPMHPDEAGGPDIEVVGKDSPLSVLLYVEVTGTERRRGDAYWVRPDKLNYAKNHPDNDVWVILHFADEDAFVFIKPDVAKQYQATRIKIGQATELFVEFSALSPERKSLEDFASHLKAKIGNGDDGENPLFGGRLGCAR